MNITTWIIKLYCTAYSIYHDGVLFVCFFSTFFLVADTVYQFTSALVLSVFLWPDEDVGFSVFCFCLN